MKNILLAVTSLVSLFGYCQSPEEAKVVSEINTYRTTFGLPKLNYDRQASAICFDHNTWQSKSDTFCHCNVQERWKLLRNVGGFNGGENLCKDCKTPTSEWIKSPPHNNILKKVDANSIGISIYNNYSTILIFKRN